MKILLRSAFDFSEYEGSLLDYVRPGYLPLYGAIDELGRAKFGQAWTGQEILIPALRPVDDLSDPALGIVHDSISNKFHVLTEDGWLTELTLERAERLWAMVSPAFKARYQHAHKARQRFDNAADQLRLALIRSELTSGVWDRKKSGKVHPIDCNVWTTTTADETFDLCHPRNFERARRSGFRRWPAPNEANVNVGSEQVIDCVVVEAEMFRAWLKSALPARAVKYGDAEALLHKRSAEALAEGRGYSREQAENDLRQQYGASVPVRKWAREAHKSDPNRRIGRPRKLI